MYQPKYVITDKLLNNIVEFEKNNYEIQQSELSGSSELEIIKRVKGLNLFHIAHVIGVDLSIKDSEKAALGNKIVTPDSRGKILNNYRNVYDYIHTSSTENFLNLDINLLMHFNKIILIEWQDSWNNKIRTSADEKDSYLDSWSNLYDKNIEPNRLQGELLALLDWYKTNNEINTALKIAVFLYRIIRLAPFMMMNKLTIISTIEYLLKKEGYTTKNFASISRIFDLNDQRLIQGANFAIENNEDCTLFIDNIIQALLLNTQDTKARISRTSRNQSRNVKKPFLDLNKRQLKILRYLQTIPTVKREDYVQMMDVSPMTSFRDLNDLLEKKLLRVEGKGRATKYMLFNR